MCYGKAVQDELAPLTRELRHAIPGVYTGYKQLHDAAPADGALDAKTKELIALAIAVSKECDGCIAAHTHAAVLRGATPAEAAETIGCRVPDERRPGHRLRGPHLRRVHRVLHPTQPTRRRPRRPTRWRAAPNSPLILARPPVPRVPAHRTPRLVVRGKRCAPGAATTQAVDAGTAGCVAAGDAA